jgi:predicted TIM-barrel fold metal-dependent hydrolase
LRGRKALSHIYNLALSGSCLRENVEIIDCHAHMGPHGEFHIPRNTPEWMIKIMDRIGVSKAAISHCISLESDFKVGNAIVYEAIKKFPNRFIGYAVLNPHYPEEIEEELERCFKHYGMKAIKFHQSLHQIKYPSDFERYRLVLEYAESNNLTMLCHGFPLPKKIEEAAREYRNVNFIIAHCGSWNMREESEALSAAKHVPNIYVDSSGSIEWYGAFEKVVDKVGSDKILFGSDFPWCNLAFMIGRILFARIPDEDKRKILGLNAKKLYKINS